MSNSQIFMQLNGYLTVTEAASYIGVSVNTLRNWDKAGKVIARTGHLTNPINLSELIDTIELLTGPKQSHEAGESRLQ